MKLLLKLYAVLFATLLFPACGEDEYTYPDLITEMSCLKTDSEGIGIQIITDEGMVWNLQKGNQPKDLTADSVYRVVSRFAPINVSEAKVYSFWPVIASLPKSKDEYPAIKRDPVSIQSIWKSGDYLNMVLQIMVKDQEHDLSFIDNGIVRNEDGTQTLKLTLFHDRKNDVEGFNQKFYLSIPLWHYQETLHRGDSIVFQLNTYQEGISSRTFIY